MDPRILGRPVPDLASDLKSGSADIRGYPHVSKIHFKFWPQLPLRKFSIAIKPSSEPFSSESVDKSSQIVVKIADILEGQNY